MRTTGRCAMMYGEAALLRATGNPSDLAVARVDVRGRSHDEAAAPDAAAAHSDCGNHAIVQRRSRCSS